MKQLLLCAVFGDPIAHSLSPIIHQQFARQCGINLSYEKQRVLVDNFAQSVTDFFKQGGLGLNITLPLKERAYALADINKPAAELARAANTLWMEQGQLVADNTDGLGLVNDISRILPLAGQSIHIFGAGGAARGIIQPLFDAGVRSITLSNRTLAKAQLLKKAFPFLHIIPWQQSIAQTDILLNTTSASTNAQAITWPNIECRLELAYDLAYDRQQMTPFLAQYQTRANRYADGMGMLIEQAAIAFLRWHQVLPDTSHIREQLI